MEEKKESLLILFFSFFFFLTATYRQMELIPDIYNMVLSQAGILLQ